jgi:hypothetical protein
MKDGRSTTALAIVLLCCTWSGGGQANPTAEDPPMNVEFTEIDTNGFVINPIWTFQRTHVNDDPPFPAPFDLCGKFAVTNSDDPSHPSFGSPPCTSQPLSVDYPYGLHDFVCVNFGGNSGSLHGHVDWMPAQYSGTLFFGDVKPWIRLGDGDYNFALVPDNRAGLTRDNYLAVPGGRAAIGVEFDSAEINSQLGSKWWMQFKKGPNKIRHSLIDGKQGGGSRAIVWGLLGVDTEHFAHSELHPVYALAVEDPSSTSDDDIWHVLVRNWGNEGFCSQFSHDLERTSLQIVIPRAGARTATVTKADVASKPAGLNWSFAPIKNGAIFSFDLGDPTGKPQFDAEFHLKWTAQSPGANLMLSAAALGTAATKTRSEFTMSSPAPGDITVADDAAESFWNTLTPAQKQKVEAKMKISEEPTGGPARKRDATGFLRSPQDEFQFLLNPPAPVVAVRLALDKEKIMRDLYRSLLICDFEQEQAHWPLINQEQCAIVRKASPSEHRE